MVSATNYLQSIYAIEGDDGGRIARTGFNYQDHIGACFCLEMLEDEHLIEIWFEYLDDITLFWKNGDSILIEFVQVKSEDRLSRWSISSLTERSNGSGSLFEKSLQNACCLEPSIFRIVTGVDVNRELDVLKLRLDSDERRNRIDEITNISNEIISRLGNFSSLNCTTIHDWAKRCYWDKRSDSEDDLTSINTYRLTKIVSRDINPIAPDHGEEVYKKLLAKVKDASSKDRSLYPSIYKITKNDMKSWLIGAVSNITTVEQKTKKLERKLSEANLRSDIIQNAKQLRLQYAFDRQKYLGSYNNAQKYNSVETEVTSVLNRELSGLDSGRINENGVQFHDRCIQELHNLKENSKLISNSPLADVPESYLVGCMYYRTNRCVHRFMRPSP